MLKNEKQTRYTFNKWIKYTTDSAFVLSCWPRKKKQNVYIHIIYIYTIYKKNECYIIFSGQKDKVHNKYKFLIFYIIFKKHFVFLVSIQLSFLCTNMYAKIYIQNIHVRYEILLPIFIYIYLLFYLFLFTKKEK